ncbi:nuclear transport factor 2 family protein [Mycolicibacterium sp. CBMA 226]|uniref:nuclear transport factor 2 family protein n=1 Tax=Mycolicibacterium sp. CBMA 226 TaxID=2606611 RepID=UPI0012DD45A3|nr:nuclear transport factor 2 family protein [Mycolicibacterium sp. CBMA 226]MUL79043.1 nuclear transport factor 2 family protein [Mycolicibacterium sp. CBMA 226]QGW61365.1 hypothetical protein ICEMyc226_00333 [Mycolicibacterium sp.]
MDLAAYIRDFNTLSRAEVVDRYYTDDCVIHMPSFMAPPDGTVRGKADWLLVLEESEETIKETVTLIESAQKEDLVMAEFDILYVSKNEEPEFVMGPLRAGTPSTFRFFGSYYLRSGSIFRLDLAWWPNAVT